MGRLLDMEEIIKFAKTTYPTEDVKKITWLLCHTPTAYDVDKVVEGLEEIKGQGCVGVKCKDCKYTHNCFEGERAENVVIDKAIEIIRRGGVE